MVILVLGEFLSPSAMLNAARRLRDLGYRDLDGYTPYPVEGSDEAFALPRSPIPAVVLACGLLGAALGYLMMFWCNAVDYPINVGGRPLNSYPAFVPITFELGILFASLGAFASLLGLTGLPKPYHPVFEIDEFRTASIDRFWLSVRLADGTSQRDLTEELSRLSAYSVKSVAVQ